MRKFRILMTPQYVAPLNCCPIASKRSRFIPAFRWRPFDPVDECNRAVAICIRQPLQVHVSLEEADDGRFL